MSLLLEKYQNMHKKGSSHERRSHVSQAILVGSDYVRRHLKIFLRSAVGGQGLSCRDADPGDSQVRKNCVAAGWCQTTPDRDGDGMAGHQDGMHVIKCLREEHPGPLLT
jgi:hypothetical protein